MLFRTYTKRTLPRPYFEQLLNEKSWTGMCRGNVPWRNGAFPIGATLEAQYIVLALVPRKHSPMQVVGFLLGLDHTYITNLDSKKRPVCNPDELYIDVMCASPKHRGTGTKLYTHFVKFAIRNGKRAIRLYSVDEALGYWKKLGFRACDTPCAKSCPIKEKRYKHDKTASRMTRCIQNDS